MKFLIAAITLIAIAANAQVFVKPDPNIKQYSATVRPFMPPALSTDMCVITGSATKVVKVTGVEVSANQATTGNNQIHLVKRTAANTGGATIAMSSAAWDTGIPAPTASAYIYATKPTALGTSAGSLVIKNVLSPVSTALGVQYTYLVEPNVFKPIVLRGTAESLAVNFDGQTSPAGFAVNCTFFFTEE